MGNSKQHEILIRYINNSLEKISKTFAAHYTSNYNLTTRQMSTLWYLKYSGQMTMSEYANKMQMSRQQATQLIQNLVNDGYVERKYDQNNRRVIYIIISSKGVNVINDIENKYTEQVFSQVKNLTPEQQKRFIEAMQDMNELLELMDFYPKQK